MRKTSIIILSYNTQEYTRLCIESIKAYTPKNIYKIIVVDNASEDDSVCCYAQILLLIIFAVHLLNRNKRLLKQRPRRR